VEKAIPSRHSAEHHSPGSPRRVQRTAPSSLPHLSQASVTQIPRSRRSFSVCSRASFMRLAFAPVSRTHPLSNPCRSRCNFYLECEGECCTWMVPRGRVELPTPAFSGPRSTGELPRHRNNERFYGKAARVGRGNRNSKTEIRNTKRNTREDAQQANRATEVMRGETLVHRLVEFAHPVSRLQDFARL
jgi:hypothetical protein